MNNAENGGNRKFTRVLYLADGIISHNNKEYKVCILDLSMRGVLIVRDEDMEIDKEGIYTVEVIIKDDNTENVTFEARIAHLTDDAIGLNLTEIELNSFDTLKKIVTLNSQDPERIIDEMIRNL